MIQRIQSLFLICSIIITAVLPFFFPLWTENEVKIVSEFSSEYDMAKKRLKNGESIGDSKAERFAKVSTDAHWERANVRRAISNFKYKVKAKQCKAEDLANIKKALSNAVKNISNLEKDI